MTAVIAVLASVMLQQLLSKASKLPLARCKSSSACEPQQVHGVPAQASHGQAIPETTCHMKSFDQSDKGDCCIAFQACRAAS